MDQTLVKVAEWIITIVILLSLPKLVKC